MLVVPLPQLRRTRKLLCPRNPRRRSGTAGVGHLPGPVLVPVLGVIPVHPLALALAPTPGPGVLPIIGAGVEAEAGPGAEAEAEVELRHAPVPDLGATAAALEDAAEAIPGATAEADHALADGESSAVFFSSLFFLLSSFPSCFHPLS